MSTNQMILLFKINQYCKSFAWGEYKYNYHTEAS